MTVESMAAMMAGHWAVQMAEHSAELKVGCWADTMVVQMVASRAGHSAEYWVVWRAGQLVEQTAD